MCEWSAHGECGVAWGFIPSTTNLEGCAETFETNQNALRCMDQTDEESCMNLCAAGANCLWSAEANFCYLFTARPPADQRHCDDRKSQLPFSHFQTTFFPEHDC